MQEATDNQIGNTDFKVNIAIITKGIKFANYDTFNYYINFIPWIPNPPTTITNYTNINSGYKCIGDTVTLYLNFTFDIPIIIGSLTFSGLPYPAKNNNGYYRGDGMLFTSVNKRLLLSIDPTVSSTTFRVDPINFSSFYDPDSYRISATLSYQI